MTNMRKIKLIALAVLATCALAVPAISSAAEPDPVVTASGIKLSGCDGTATASLLMYVRGIDCERAIDMANAATSEDEPCPIGWHDRRARLMATYGGKKITGPYVFLCTQKSGKRAFTYKPITG